MKYSGLLVKIVDVETTSPFAAVNLTEAVV